MTSIDQDDDAILDAGLEALCGAVPAAPSIDLRQVREYMYVGEPALALDLLGHLHLASADPPSSETRQLFDTLARILEIVDGDEWTGVAAIRTR